MSAPRTAGRAETVSAATATRVTMRSYREMSSGPSSAAPIVHAHVPVRGPPSNRRMSSTMPRSQSTAIR